MSVYRPVLFDQAAESIMALSRRQQRQAMQGIKSVAQHPFVPSDFSTTDTEGRTVEHRLIDAFVFSYWVDHAARHVMITEIEFTD